MTGLRARLAAWAAIIALATTGLPGLWLTWRAYRALRTEAFESQLLLARSLAHEIDGELQQIITAVEAAAKRPWPRDDPGRLVLRLNNVMNTAEGLSDLLVVDSDGRILARALHEEAPPPLPGPRRRYLVGLALEKTDENRADVVILPDGKRVLQLARAINRDAVVLAQYRLESQALGNLEGLLMGQSGFAYVADDQGKPQVLPSAQRQGEADLAFSFDGKEYVREVRRPAGSDLLAVAPIDSLGWAVAVRRPLDEAEAPARRMRRELFIFTALALMAGGALAMALARPLVNSLLALAAAARRIEGGSLDPSEIERLPATDEVGEVASALAHMTRALKVQQAQREQAHSRALAAEKRLARNERLAALGQLAAGLAHELNNPLMVIHGAAGEAAATAPKSARVWLDRVQRESERCSRLVRELLDYARPRNPHWRPFDLALLLREAFEAARVRREAVYELKLDLGADAKVRGDRDQFYQVLLNLFGNAMDAMPGGGPLSAGLAADEKGWRLGIRDQGSGVPQRSREAVFRPFFTSKAKGTGLGLAIARNMMVGHGGSLRCLPVRGKGACFEAAWPANPRKEHA